jgi:uncharacterized membrane protein YdjX (TVP38/TMEM64 family)
MENTASDTHHEVVEEADTWPQLAAEDADTAPLLTEDADEDSSSDEHGERPRRIEILIALVSILLGVIAVAAIPELRHAVSLVVHGHLAALRTQIRGLGAAGVAMLAALMLAHAVLFYPTEIVTATSGFAYGFAPGLALALAGWLASGLFAFALGRTIGRPLAVAIFGRQRFSALERAIERGGTPLLLAGRLIPVVPFSLMCYAAGAARVGVWRFSWTTVVGFLPITASVAYLGSQAKSLSLSDPFVWMTLAVFVLLIAATRLLGGGRSERLRG